MTGRRAVGETPSAQGLDRRLAVIDRAVIRYRSRSDRDPAHDRVRLTRGLDVLADRLAENRQWDEALAALREGVAVTRMLARGDGGPTASADPGRDPDADHGTDRRFRRLLAARLLKLSSASYAGGDMATAIASAGEAARLHWDDPDTCEGLDLRAGLAALQQLSRALAVTGDAAGAVAAVGGAVAALRDRVERRARESAGSIGVADGDGGRELAWALGILGMRLRLAGDLAAARRVIAEALALLESSGPGTGREPTGESDAVRAYLRQEYESLDRLLTVRVTVREPPPR